MPDQTEIKAAPQGSDALQGRSLKVLLAGPRGFCAGVDRAIRVVEEAIRRYGAPVYVRHEIVHNRTVVEELEARVPFLSKNSMKCRQTAMSCSRLMACPRRFPSRPNAATCCI